MALIGVNRMDDGIKAKGGEERKVINVEASLVDEVNEYAEELDERLGFKPTFSQTLKYIVKELKKRKA